MPQRKWLSSFPPLAHSTTWSVTLFYHSVFFALGLTLFLSEAWCTTMYWWVLSVNSIIRDISIETWEEKLDPANCEKTVTWSRSALKASRSILLLSSSSLLDEYLLALLIKLTLTACTPQETQQVSWLFPLVGRTQQNFSWYGWTWNQPAAKSCLKQKKQSTQHLNL